MNPHKFGVVAGADAHTSFSDNEEFNYTGVHGINDATIKARLSGAGQTAGEAAIMFGTPGATAVWAHENTRTEIFDGIQRKESYGTSGPLIRLRFFGGWGYENNLHQDKDFVKKAYAGGVPMGGDLPAKPNSATWTDPDFDPALHAVYYVRVIEIPTPRWSTYDAKSAGVEPLGMVPASIQERAWSSPI